MDANFPPGTMERDIDGDGSMKLYTVEIVVRVCVEARDDDEAIEESENAMSCDSNADIKSIEILDHEPA